MVRGRAPLAVQTDGFYAASVQVRNAALSEEPGMACANGRLSLQQLISPLKFLVLSLSLSLALLSRPPTMTDSHTTKLALRLKRAHSPGADDPSDQNSAVAGASQPMNDIALPIREREILQVWSCIALILFKSLIKISQRGARRTRARWKSCARSKRISAIAGRASRIGVSCLVRSDHGSWSMVRKRCLVMRMRVCSRTKNIRRS